MSTWISGTHGIVKAADINFVFSEKAAVYDWRIFANTHKNEKVLLYADLNDAKDCAKRINEIMAVLKLETPRKTNDASVPRVAERHKIIMQRPVCGPGSD